MGFRFRKSIKLAPGIRLNISKRGFSSIGVGRLNFGSRGVYQNLGIPGTGISYRSRIVGQSKAQSGSSRTKQGRTTTVSVTLALAEDGSLLYLDANRKPLTETLVQATRKQQRPFLVEWLTEQCEIYNSARESLRTFHLHTPAPSGDVSVNPKPQPQALQKYGLMSSLFDSQKQKTDARNEQFQQTYEQDMLKWERAEQSLRSDVEVMSTVITTAFSSIEWPRETSVSFELSDKGGALLLDVDFPEVEDFPTQQAKVNSKDLRLAIKDLPNSQLQLDYLTHIHAIGFRLIGDAFAHLPALSLVVLSGYSQRTNKKSGQLEDEYLYSVRVQRSAWEQINFKNLEAIDVVASFEQFELRRNVTQRSAISAIEPFQG